MESQPVRYNLMRIRALATWGTFVMFGNLDELMTSLLCFLHYIADKFRNACDNNSYKISWFRTTVFIPSDKLPCMGDRSSASSADLWQWAYRAVTHFNYCQEKICSSEDFIGIPHSHFVTNALAWVNVVPVWCPLTWIVIWSGIGWTGAPTCYENLMKEGLLVFGTSKQETNTTLKQSNSRWYRCSQIRTHLLKEGNRSAYKQTIACFFALPVHVGTISRENDDFFN